MQFPQIRGWLARLAGCFTKSRQEREFAAELESHLEMHIEDNMRAGMTEEEARRHALIKLGGIEPTKERYRRQRGLPLLETLIQDLRFGLRMLVKSPGFSAIAILSLALGIGANTAIFSLANTLLLRPLPVASAEQIVSLANSIESRSYATFSYPNYRDLRDRNSVFDGLIAYRFAPLSLSYEGVNRRMWGYVVTGNYFQVLGVNAALGRLITPEDDRQPDAHPVTVLSHRCWQQQFGADPAIIGKRLIVNGRSYTVIGVAPAEFIGTDIIASPEWWFPMAMQAEIEAGNRWLEQRGVENVFVQGRLKPGISRAQAQTELNAIALELARAYPDFNEKKRVTVAAPGLLGGAMRAPVLGFIGLLMVVVAFVLLLACTNLANLLLARANERRKEIAVRLALGASRPRLVWQLLTESLLLAVISGLLGLAFAYWLVRLAVLLKPPVDVPLFINLHIDYRVLIFTALISLLTGLLFGLLPALQSTKLDLLSVLKDDSVFSGSRSSWWKSALIVLQVALSLVLLAGGGLMVRALQRAQTIDLGFNPQNAVEVSVDLQLQGYDRARAREFQKRWLERVRALPGVQYAGIADLVPVDLHFSRDYIFIAGQAPERLINAPRAMTSRVSPGYFQAMGTRIVQGRDFTDQDDENAPRVAIINETCARRFWPGQSPLGQRFRQGSPQSPLLEVVGVVEDGKYAGLNEEPKPYVCRPFWQAYSGSTTLVARTDQDAQIQLARIVGELQQLDPHLPVASAKSLAERLALPLLPARFAASALGSFGILALALAAIGLYGVMSYAVSRRTHEIGVRIALGAQTLDILKLTVAQGMRLALIGVTIGLAAALALARLMKSLLFGMSAADPLTYAAVALVLILVALLACYIPARRATKIDPMTALRYE